MERMRRLRQQGNVVDVDDGCRKGHLKSGSANPKDSEIGECLIAVLKAEGDDIPREIHDEANQLLISAAFNLDRALTVLPQAFVGRELLQQAKQTLDECVEELHRTKVLVRLPVVYEPRKCSASRNMLTNRERDILRLIGQGCTSKEIGRKLFLSPKTVENYRARILGKLQVKNCAEAISLAITQGMIDPLSR